MNRNVISITKRQGEALTITELQNTVLSIYAHVNALIPDDIAAVTTRQFKFEPVNLDIPNYCGLMSSQDVTYSMDMSDYQYGLVDSVIQKLIREIDDTLEEI